MPKSPPQAAGRGRPKAPDGLTIVTRPGSTALYIRGTVRGQTVFKSAGTSDRALAEEARSALQNELYRLAVHGIEKRKSLTFVRAAHDYLNRPADGRPVSAQTKMLLARIVQHLGQTITCDQIDQAVIDTAAKALCRADAKAATILRSVVTPIKAVLTYAAEGGWCSVPRFRRSKGSGRRTEWFAPDEAERLIAGAAEHAKPLLEFAFSTGCRLGEALSLEWRNVDLRHNRVILTETKNTEDRIVDMPPRAVAALANLPGDRVGRVFLHPNGNPAINKTKMVPYRLTSESKFGSGGGQIKRTWGTAMKSAGITRNLTPHSMRHTWATWHFCVHKDVKQLQEDGGWKTLSQCARYLKLAPNGLRDEILAFWNGATATAGNVQSGVMVA